MIFALVLFALSTTLAARQCSALRGGSNLTVAITPIDGSVDWQPRFAGEAGDGKVVFVVTSKKTLYISQDDGISWIPISKDPKIMAPLQSGDKVQVFSVFFTAAAATSFYALGSSNGVPTIWTSSDSGQTWTVHRNTAPSIIWMYTHPILANVAIGLAWGPNSRQTNLTTDIGMSWERIAGNTTFTTTFACEDAACQRRSAVIYQTMFGEWNDCDGGKCSLQYRTFDPSKTSKQALSATTKDIMESCDGLAEVQWPWYELEAKRVLFTSAHITPKSDSDPVEQRIYYSRNGGLNWTLAQFPFGNKRHHFRFVTTESDVMLVGVRDINDGTDYGAIYMSSNGVEEGLFVLSLRHVRFSSNGLRDSNMFTGALELERSAELDGVFIANRYRGIDGFIDNKCVQTVITFDYGKTWSMIPRPASYGPCPKDTECFLHLRLAPEDFPTAYSPTDAVGVWLAQGNAGECLSEKAESTYYSSDGGRTWVVMSTERVIFEVSNHGALVTGAVTDRLTNELIYTLDDGATFETCQFRDINMSVKNILTRSFNAKNFILEGSEASGDFGVLAHFDFSDAQARNCEASDYENWSPAQCLLGRHIVWQRRKPDSNCHNPIEREIESMETSCVCTEDDFECDFCYEIDPLHNKCVLTNTQTCQRLAAAPQAACADPSNTAQTYVVSDGYRLEPNNKCKGGVTHGELKKCPAPATSSPVIGGGSMLAVAVIFVGLVLAAVVGVGIYCFIKRRKPPTYAPMGDQSNSLFDD